jgi:hypothetical protein
MLARGATTRYPRTIMKHRHAPTASPSIRMLIAAALLLPLTGLPLAYSESSVAERGHTGS